MSIDTQNLNKILERLRDLDPDKPLAHDLILSVTGCFIPRLFSSVLLDSQTCHYEYLITKNIRSWFKIDQPDERWTNILNNALQYLTDEAIDSLPEASRQKIYRYKASHGMLYNSNARVHQHMREVIQRYDISRIHNDELSWFNDPYELQRLSLLQNLPNQPQEGMNPTLLRALFDSAAAYGVDSNELIKYICSFPEQAEIGNYLNAEQIQQRILFNAVIEQGLKFKKDLDEVVQRGKNPAANERNGAESDLQELADRAAGEIQRLQPGQSWVFCGETVSIAPKIKLSGDSNDPFYKLVQKILDSEGEDELVNRIMAILPPEISEGTMASMLPDEAHEVLRGMLRNGVMNHFFSRISHSLTEGRSLPGRILWTPVEWGRQYLEGKLADYCSSFSQQITDVLAVGFTDEMIEQMRLAILDENSNLEQIVRDQVRLFLTTHIHSLQKGIGGALAGVAGLMPEFVHDLFRAFNLGELGVPAKHLWYAFEKQTNGKYTLTVFGTSFKLRDVDVSKIDRDHMMRMLSYGVWPEWRPGASFKIGDIEKGFLIPLEGRNVGTVPPESNNLIDITNAFFRQQLRFEPNSVQEKLYRFGLLKKGIRDIWTHVQHSTDYFHNHPRALRDIQDANRALCTAALNLFENGGHISLNELKCIYATSKSIIQTLQQYETSRHNALGKHSIAIPPELLPRVHELIISARGSRATLQTIKELLLDALGEEVGETIDQIVSDLVPDIPNIPDAPPLEVPTAFQEFRGWLGRQFWSQAYLHFGLSTELITNPTYFSISYCVSRVALFILMPGAAIRLSVSIIAQRAFSDFAEWCFPEMAKKIAHLKRRILITITAQIFLSDEQRDHFTALVNLWQAKLTHAGRISYETKPHFQPTTLASFRWNRPVVTKEIPFNVAPLKDYPLPYKIETDAKSIVEETGIWIETADKMLKENSELSSECCIFLNAQMKQLPVPLPEDPEDDWGTMPEREARLCLEQISELAVRLRYSQEIKHYQLSQDLKNRTTVNLYKALAIIDKLARRFPENHLNGFKVNAWALAWWPKNAAFRIIDFQQTPGTPSYHEQLIQLQRYFGIVPNKDYTNEEVWNRAHKKNVDALWDTSSILFYEDPDESRSSYISPYQCGGPGDTSYYSKVMEDPAVKRRMEARGIDESSTTFDKFCVLYKDPIKENEPPEERGVLPRHFKQLRLIELLASTSCIIDYQFGTRYELGIRTVDDFNISLESSDSEIRKGLNFLTGRYFFGKSEDEELGATFKKMPGTSCQAMVGKHQYNFASLQSREKHISTDYLNYFLWHSRIKEMNPYKGAKNTYDFPAVINYFMHRDVRPINNIVIESQSFPASTGKKSNRNKKPNGIAERFISSITSALIKKPEEDKNALSELPAESRRVVEIMRSHGSDQIVRALAFFSENMQVLKSENFMLLLNILLSHEHVLQSQLLAQPDFSITLGEFFCKAYAHFKLHSSDAESRIALEAIVTLGIITKLSVEAIVPNGGRTFPNLRELLHKNDFARKYVLMLPYLAIDPKTASDAQKQEAIFDICLGLPSYKSTEYNQDIEMKRLCAEVITLWEPTIRHELNNNSELRNHILNTIAQSNSSLKENVTWLGSYPEFDSGIMQINLLEFPQTLVSDQAERENIREGLTKIYGIEGNNFNISRTNNVYDVTDGHIAVTVVEKRALNNSVVQELRFKKTVDSKVYVWVQANQQVETGNNITYWLEENQTNGYSELLILENGEVKSRRSVLRQPGDDQLEVPKQFSLRSNSILINGELCQRADLSSETHNLGPLSWFQPLSSIEAYRTTEPPYIWKQITFKDLDLTFNVQEDGRGELRAMNDAGDYIAPVQHQVDKRPVLTSHARYLLLENSGGEQQVLIPTDSLRSNLGATVLRYMSGVTLSPLMESSLNTLLNQSVDAEGTRKYHTYTFDSDGRLDSNDPEAILHLLCHHMQELLTVSGSAEEILHYLNRLETLANQQALSKDVYDLCTKMELCAVLFNNDMITRLALRLNAVTAKNKLEFSADDPNENNVSDPTKAIYWVATQWNFSRFNRKDSNIISINEEQELCILRNVAHTSAGMCKELVKKAQQADAFKKSMINDESILNYLGIDRIAEALLMLPSMAERLEFLNYKYGPDSQQYEITFRSLVRHMIFGSSASSPNEPVANNARRSPSTEFSILESIWDILADRHVYDFDHNFLKEADLNLDWELLPVRFAEITPQDLKKYFFHYYRLAIGETPPNCKDNESKEIFKANSERFRESLKMMHGKQWGNECDGIINCLRIASGALFGFPSALDCETAIQKHKNLLGIREETLKEHSALPEDERERKERAYETKCREAKVAVEKLLSTIKSSCGRSSLFSNVFSMKSLKGLTSFAENNIRVLIETTVAGSVSNILNINGITPPLLVPLGRLGIFLYRSLPLVKATYDAAQKERTELNKSLTLSNDPLANNFQVLLDQLDSDLKRACISLRDDYLEPIPEADQKTAAAHRRMGPFTPPNDDPATVKRFAKVNADLDYYYNHPYQPPQQYRIEGIRNYYRLVSQLQGAGKSLHEHLQVMEKDILYFAKERNHENQPEDQLIPNLMKGSAQIKQRLPKEQLHEMLHCLIGTDKELLSLTNLKPEQLPQLKQQLFQYLIKVTRLQQLQRALKKLEQIEKLKPNDPDLPIRLEELTFELSRERAYVLNPSTPDDEHPAVPGRFIAGYLLFEYGSNKMIWSSQLEQLQKQLLAHFKHKNICTEQPTGTGKTVVSNPIISTLLSDRKQFVWNTLTDDLIASNTPDLTKANKNTADKKTHVIEIDRNTPLTARNLNSRHLSLLSALQRGDNVCSKKRTPQSLELRCIEELLNYSLSGGDNLEQEETIRAYAELLDFIETHGLPNLDELHKHSRRSDELNHPQGNENSKLKLKDSERKVHLHFVYFLCHPDLMRLDNIRHKLQPKFSLKVYNEQIKPKLAKMISEDPLLEVAPENRDALTKYLMDPAAPIPDFVMKSKMRSEIALAKGDLLDYYKEIRKGEINKTYGRGDAEFAVPCVGLNQPSKISTYRNPHEGCLRTNLDFVFNGLDQDQALKLLKEMHAQAKNEAQEKSITFEDTETAKSFYQWCHPHYQDKPCRLSDFLPDSLNNGQLKELATALNKTYAAPLQYSYWFPTKDITYFEYNTSSNSQNSVSMFSGNVGGTASPNDEETFYRGTHLIPAHGTTGAYIDHVGNTCNKPDSIIEIDAKDPADALTKILQRTFTRESGNSILVDTGALFNGINREFVAREMMRHIVRENLEWECIFYFSETGEQVYIPRPKNLEQVDSLMSRPLKNCTIALNKRAGYFDEPNTLGQDVPQDPKHKAVHTHNFNTNAERRQQGDGRNRQYKQGGKQSKVEVITTALRQHITGDRPAGIDDLILHGEVNEAEPKGYESYLSAHQQIEDVTRKTVLYRGIVKTILQKGVKAMLPIFNHFKRSLVQVTEKDPFVRHAFPQKSDANPYEVLNNAKETQFKRLRESEFFEESDLKEAWASFAPLGQGTYPKYVTVDAVSLTHRSNDIGLCQEVVQTQNQQQQQNQNVNHEEQQLQEVQQNQHLQTENHLEADKKDRLRLELAEWPKINYFANLNWLGTRPTHIKTNHRSAIFYNVEESIKSLGVEDLKSVHHAFSGSMWWSNNQMGVLSSGKLAAPGGKFKVPIFEILVVHYTNPQGEVQVVTGAIHPDEAAAWRQRFREDHASEPDRRNPNIKIGLFDLATNSVVDSGYNRLSNQELFASEEFSDDLPRWKFLAGQVSIQQRRPDSEQHDAATYEKFKQWIETNDQEKMKEAFLKIYKYRGIRPIIGSDMEYLFVHRDEVLVDVNH